MSEVKLPTDEGRLPASRFVCGRKGMEVSPYGHYVLASVYDAQSLALDEARKKTLREEMAKWEAIKAIEAKVAEKIVEKNALYRENVRLKEEIKRWKEEAVKERPAYEIGRGIIKDLSDQLSALKAGERELLEEYRRWWLEFDAGIPMNSAHIDDFLASRQEGGKG